MATRRDQSQVVPKETASKCPVSEGVVINHIFFGGINPI